MTKKKKKKTDIKIKIKITKAGIASMRRASLQPNKAAIYPHDNEPIKAPKQIIEPSQEISAIVTGPDSSGVSSDCRIESAGDNQPIMTPCENIIVFASQRKNKNILQLFYLKKHLATD